MCDNTPIKVLGVRGSYIRVMIVICVLWRQHLPGCDKVLHRNNNIITFMVLTHWSGCLINLTYRAVFSSLVNRLCCGRPEHDLMPG